MHSSAAWWDCKRTVVPLIGSQEIQDRFHDGHLSFIVSFGVVKAVANLVSGHFADVYGRKICSCSAGSSGCQCHS